MRSTRTLSTGPQPALGVPAASPNRIKQLPDRHELAHNIWLVHSPLLVRDLSNDLGMGDDPLGSGVVFRLNGTYWGRSDQNTWDWLSRYRSSACW